jgi:hypothetical protein
VVRLGIGVHASGFQRGKCRSFSMADLGRLTDDELREDALQKYAWNSPEVLGLRRPFVYDYSCN